MQDASSCPPRNPARADRPCRCWSEKIGLFFEKNSADVLVVVAAADVEYDPDWLFNDTAAMQVHMLQLHRPAVMHWPAAAIQFEESLCSALNPSSA